MIKQNLTAHAVRLAEELGLLNLTKENVCAHAGLPLEHFRGVADGTFAEFQVELIGLVSPEALKKPLDRSTRSRVNSEVRKASILALALDVADRIGWHRLEVRDVAECAGLTPMAVYCYFPSVQNLRESVMQAAIERRFLPVIAAGIAAKNDRALSLDADTKSAALQSLA